MSYTQIQGVIFLTAIVLWIIVLCVNVLWGLSFMLAFILGAGMAIAWELAGEAGER